MGRRLAKWLPTLKLGVTGQYWPAASPAGQANDSVVGSLPAEAAARGPATFSRLTLQK